MVMGSGDAATFGGGVHGRAVVRPAVKAAPLWRADTGARLFSIAYVCAGKDKGVFTMLWKPSAGKQDVCATAAVTMSTHNPAVICYLGGMHVHMIVSLTTADCSRAVQGRDGRG